MGVLAHEEVFRQKIPNIERFLRVFCCTGMCDLTSTASEPSLSCVDSGGLPFPSSDSSGMPSRRSLPTLRRGMRKN